LSRIGVCTYRVALGLLRVELALMNHRWVLFLVFTLGVLVSALSVLLSILLGRLLGVGDSGVDRRPGWDVGEVELVRGECERQVLEDVPRCVRTRTRVRRGVLKEGVLRESSRRAGLVLTCAHRGSPHVTSRHLWSSDLLRAHGFPALHVRHASGRLGTSGEGRATAASCRYRRELRA
jgi:hypothetical protein